MTAQKTAARETSHEHQANANWKHEWARMRLWEEQANSSVGGGGGGGIELHDQCKLAHKTSV